MKYVVMFSGGVGSWAAAKRLKERGEKDVTLLFADTLIEDKDLYRFLEEAAKNVGYPLVKVSDGRDIWQVFKDRKILGNSNIAPCSHLLKQKPSRQWMEENAKDATVVVGIDWTEEHRLVGARKGWAPWNVEAPLCEPPLRWKTELMSDLEQEGIELPRLYKEGFPHNNCGGGCVRAGKSHFRHLFRMRPETFAEWERNEQSVRDFLKKDVTILTKMTNREKKPITLRELREELEMQPSMFADDEWGGCGCFLDEETQNE